MAFTLDDTDLRIIRLLQGDGRMSNVDIGRSLGMSEATVRKRVDRMIADKAIRVVALPDLDAVHCSVVTVTTLCVDLAQSQRIAMALAAMPEVRWVAQASGEYDLIFEAAFASHEQLLRFLTVSLGALPGIRRLTTSHLLRPLKSVADWHLPSPPPPVVLIVDDDQDYVEMTSTVLEAGGYRTLSAASGNEALACMRREHPAVVIMDVMMEGLLDGLDASRSIRLDQSLQRIPIIMVSSIQESPDELFPMAPESEMIRPDRYIAKPLDARVLLEALAKALGPKRSQTVPAP